MSDACCVKVPISCRVVVETGRTASILGNDSFQIPSLGHDPAARSCWAANGLLNFCNLTALSSPKPFFIKDKNPNDTKAKQDGGEKALQTQSSGVDPMMTQNSLPQGHHLTMPRGTIVLLGMPFVAAVY